MADKVITSTTPTPCGCCGEVVGPFLILPFYPPLSGGGWYASLAIATAEMASLARDCLAAVLLGEDGVEDLTAVTTSPTEVDLEMDWHGVDTTANMAGVISVNQPAGATLSVAYNLVTNAASSGDLGYFEVDLYLDDGSSWTSVDLNYAEILATSISGTFNFSIPSAGAYVLVFSVIRYDGPPASGHNWSTNATFALTSTGAISANRVRALYDIGEADPGVLDCT